jgi:hypothetical protein
VELMAGFSSLDNLISNVSNSGKFFRADWNKNHATGGTVIAGSWQCLLGGAGNPGANTQLGSGVTLVQKPLYDFTSTAGAIQHGGAVNAAYDGYKVLLNASAYSAAATTMPAVFMLCDFLSYATLTNATISTAGTKTFANTENVTFSSSSGLLMTSANDYDTYTPVRFTTTTTLPTGLVAATTYWTIRVSATTSRLATTLQNAIAGTAIAFTDAGTGTHTVFVRHPRYTDGAGVMPLLVASTAGTAGTGTFQLTYTNQAGTGSRTTPSSPALPTNTAVAPLLTVPYSGTGSGKFGPFMPLAGGDSGVREVTNIILGSAGVTTGVYNMVFAKPLLTLPMTTLGVAAERDLVNQLPSMPRVFDGACLGWLCYAGAAIPNNSAFYGHLDFGWS